MYMTAASAASINSRRRTSCSWMEPVVDRAHALFEHVRVDLRRRQIGVTEHHLDRPEVRAALEQVGGERVTQHVRAEGLRQSGLRRVALEDLPEANPSQARTATACVHEQTRTATLADQLRT